MKTHRPAKPIEIMIDRAAGVPLRTMVPIRILLRCPKCKRSDPMMPADPAYPDGTTSIEVTCPPCNGGKIGDDLVFLDANRNILT